ncbi:Acg family FMN-binding oxidoreductase [Leptolyngbya sp. AN02str]|uniref:Acg family FMN-binding oxidoreductase n=1 Tax=Leptolyngbya sp. AN02str TaxID=3423363 RepID=UPI003D315306
MNDIAHPLLQQDALPIAPLCEQLKFMLGYVVMAPSSHNTQPWIFQLTQTGVDLYADRKRSLPIVDPQDRSLIMSCGAALMNLRIVLQHFGFTARVRLLPTADQPDLLAQIQIIHHNPGRPSPVNELFAAIPHRHMNRGAYEPTQIPASILSNLQTAAQQEGAWLHWITNGQRATVAELIAEGDRQQMKLPAFRHELAKWMIPNTSQRRDGMPGSVHGMGNWVSLVGPLVIRQFDLGNSQAHKDYQLALEAPALAVIATAFDTPYDWLIAGQALEHVLLQAWAAGVDAALLNQPIEVPSLRDRLRSSILLSGTPQLLLRLGYGGATATTPRRWDAEVVREPMPSVEGAIPTDVIDQFEDSTSE